MKPRYSMQSSVYLERSHSRVSDQQGGGLSLIEKLETDASTDLNGQCMVIIGQGNDILEAFSNHPGHIFNSSNGNLGALISRVSPAMAKASARFTIGQLTGAAFGALAGARMPIGPDDPETRASEIMSMADHLRSRQRDVARDHARNYLIIQLIERGTGAAGIDLGSNSLRAGQLVGLLGPHV